MMSDTIAGLSGRRVVHCTALANVTHGRLLCARYVALSVCGAYELSWAAALFA